jgi:hypothetical protein
MSNVPKTIDQLLNDYAQAWRGDGNGTTAEAFPDPLRQRVEELEAALRPFAAAYEAWGMAGHEGILVKVSLAVDWFEAAARALGES